MTDQQILTKLPASVMVGVVAQARLYAIAHPTYIRQLLRSAAGMPSALAHDFGVLLASDANPPGPLDSSINIRFSADEVTAFGDAAELRGWSRSAWIRAVLGKVAG